MLKTILLMLFCASTLVPAERSDAAAWYVDTTNPTASDSNPGTPSLPWKTIQHAAMTAAAGDVVTIQPGEYNEFIASSTSGSAGNPIVFQGVRGVDGSWQTVIDPSTPISNGWAVAKELGTNVYKYTNLPFVAQEMTINHKDVAFVCALDASYNSALTEAYAEVTSGAELMTAPSDKQYTNPQTGYSAPYWNGLEALFACTNQSALYLRLRDGSNPNGLNIRVSPNWDYAHAQFGCVLRPAWKFNGASYVTISNLLIRGAYAAVQITGSSHDIKVASNYLANGTAGVKIQSGSYNNVISNNQITQDYYGCSTPGPWDGASSANLIAMTNGNLYVIGKFVMGADQSAYGSGVVLSECGSGNVICGNHIFSGTANGINLSSTVPMTNTFIYSNRIENYPSAGFLSNYGEVGTHFYDNFVGNCNANMRFNCMDRADETINRLVYIYRNRFWLPEGFGEHAYVHWYGPPVVPVNYPEYWVYHNSFSGGHDGFGISTTAPIQGGMPNCRFIDNVFSCPYYVYASLAFWTNGAMVGVFDYNMIVPPLVTYPSSVAPAWFLSHNVTNSTIEWSYTSEPDFALHPGSSAIDAAIDVTRPFTILGITHDALPSTMAVEYGNAWDIGALEYTLQLAPPTGLNVVRKY